MQTPLNPAEDPNFQGQLDDLIQGIRAQGTGATEERGNAPRGFIFAIQEPYVAYKKLTYINGSINIFDKDAENARAALVMSRNLNCWPVPEYMTPDLAVARLLLPGNKHVYIVSLYADGKKGAVPAKLRLLVEQVRLERSQIIIMGDTNSHSEALWNGKRTDGRGGPGSSLS